MDGTATADDVPDGLSQWWETFNNGVAAAEDEEGTDSDYSGFEQGEAEADAHASAGRKRSGGATRDCDVAEEEVSEDVHFQHEAGLQGMKREATTKGNSPRATGDEIRSKEGQGEYVSDDNIGDGFQGRKRKAAATPGKLWTAGTGIKNKKSYGGCLRAENQMLRLQLVRKTKELEAEQIRRLELELHFMTKENESLRKQNAELRAENEYYRKTAKPHKTRRLCRFCKEYALDHDYRNCPQRLSSAISEEDE